MDIVKNVFQELRLNGEVTRGATVFVGVSGGVDSMVLLHLLEALRHRLGVRIVAAHFDHRLRQASSKDRKTVQAFCERLNIPLVWEQHAKCNRSQKVSENKAREWRFSFFLRAMKEAGADRLLLGHHQDDLAETVLMRIIRGCGLEGARAILPVSSIQGMTVLRPLLGASRKQIEQYARDHHVPFCNDESNDQEFYFRNKIRKRLLPLLKKSYNRNITQALAQLSRCAMDDYLFIHHEMLKRLKENIVIRKGTIKIKAVFFLRQPATVAHAALRYAYKALSSRIDLMTFEHVRAALSFTKIARSGERILWPDKIYVCRTKQFIEFLRC